MMALTSDDALYPAFGTEIAVIPASIGTTSMPFRLPAVGVGTGVGVGGTTVGGGGTAVGEGWPVVGADVGFVP